MCDESEVAVIDYKEYLHWVGYIYGLNSNTYNNALPDTMVGHKYFSIYKGSYDTLFNYKTLEVLDNYIHFPSYNDYSIVGITYEQAIDYANWRSDRVLEMMLFEYKLIKLHTNSDSSNYFTAARYVAGQYYNYKPPKNLHIPKYRLPTVEEWELCAQYKDGKDWGSVDTITKAVRKYKKRGDDLFLTKELFLSALQKAKQEKSDRKVRIPYCAPVRSFYPNGNGLYNMIGNVAEMTTYQGIAKGGSWFHTLFESKIKSNIIYQEPEAWLGFRNVCTWVKVN
jgi:formylglycine-generating enzyme